MQHAVTRRAFLQGNRSAEPSIRPPGAGSEAHFLANCDRCRRCLNACEQHLIYVDATGFPAMHFPTTGCSFCGDCRAACPRDALSNGHSIAADIRVNQNCLSASGVTCRICVEACDTSAIRVRVRVGGDAIPMISDSNCNGCGECVALCPINAITALPRTNRSDAYANG